MASTKRFNYRPKGKNETASHSWRNPTAGGSTFDEFERLSNSRGMNARTQAQANVATGSQGLGRSNNDNPQFVPNNANGQNRHLPLPSKRIKVCSEDNGAFSLPKKDSSFGIDLEDDDFESGLAMEDLDQIEFEASQAVNKGGNGNISTDTRTLTFSHPASVNNEQTRVSNTRSGIPLFDYSTQVIKHAGSRGSLNQSKTIELFTSTAVTQQGSMSATAPVALTAKIEQLEKQINEYEQSVTEYKNKHFQKDGEIKILRQSLQRAEDDLRQERLSNREADNTRKQMDLEKDRNYQKEIESLKTQLQFKSKEVEEALLKMKVGQSPKSRKVTSVSDIPFEVDGAFLSQVKNRDRGITYKDACEQTEGVSAHQCTKTSLLPNAKMDVRSNANIEHLLLKLHTNCPYCMGISSSGKVYQNRDALIGQSNKPVENTDNLLRYYVHIVLLAGIQSSSQRHIQLDTVIPAVLLLKHDMQSDHGQHDWVVALDIKYKVESLQKTYEIFREGLIVANTGKHALETEHKCGDDTNTDTNYEYFSYLGLKVFALACEQNSPLQEALISEVCNADQLEEEDQKEEPSGDPSYQKLSSEEQIILKAFIIVLLKGVKYYKSKKMQLLLFDIIHSLSRNVTTKEISQRFVQTLASHDVISAILVNECKAAFLNGIGIIRALSGIENIKALLCTEKDTCPLLKIYQCVASPPEWLSSTDTIEVKLKVVQVLSTVFATNPGVLRQILESECDCSHELIGSIVQMLLPEVKFYRNFVADSKGFAVPETDTRFVLLRQGMALLITVCINDRFLVDHRLDIEKEYAHVLHGAVMLFSNIPTVPEHEVLAIQDLLEYDQYEEEEARGSGMKGIEPMITD